MIKKCLTILLFTISIIANAQIETDTIDTKYLEDQLYISLTYNILVNKPKNDKNNLFSGNLSAGFIKDIPFNKQRNFGIGIGVGYNLNTYNSNVLILLDEEVDISDDFKYYTNTFQSQLIEFPFEIRWRTSTATKYNFWRIYSGFKFGYLFHSKTKLEYLNKKITIKNSDIYNKFQYGITLSAGYGTWNIYAYYGLSPIFDITYEDGSTLNLKDFKIGLIFYIL